MNSYLKLAEKVLTNSAHPLSARQILRIAYQMQLVPPDLFGKTQHKTLQARLAEDILRRREQSQFARTAPGRFILRQRLHSLASRKRFGGEYIAPLRSDQLRRFEVLTLQRSSVLVLREEHGRFPPLAEIERLQGRYVRLADVIDDDDLYYMRVFVLLCRGAQVLLHRSPASFGDPQRGAISLGLIGFVKREDRSLFSTDPFGVSEAAMRTVFEQLRLPVWVLGALTPTLPTSATTCIIADEGNPASNAIAAVYPFTMPDELDADALIKEAENLQWQDWPVRLNDISHMDSWSQALLKSDELGSLLKHV